ncbi:MAG: hypothetical protein ABEI06_08020 [Halobacteriaceae archaeon]
MDDETRRQGIVLFLFTIIIATLIPNLVGNTIESKLLLALGIIVAGSLLIYLFHIQRLQDSLGEQTIFYIKRVVAILVFAYLLTVVLVGGVGILSANGIVGIVPRPVVYGIAILIAAIIGLQSDPDLLVRFTAVWFILEFLFQEVITGMLGRPLVTNTVIYYIGFLLITMGLSYVLVYEGGMAWLREIAT